MIDGVLEKVSEWMTALERALTTWRRVSYLLAFLVVTFLLAYGMRYQIVATGTGSYSYAIDRWSGEVLVISASSVTFVPPKAESPPMPKRPLPTIKELLEFYDPKK